MCTKEKKMVYRNIRRISDRKPIKFHYAIYLQTSACRDASAARALSTVGFPRRLRVSGVPNVRGVTGSKG